MAHIRLNDRQVDVNILEELEPFTFDNMRQTGDKIMASSPFRYDNSPSFFINIGDNDYAGTWADSGATDDYFAKGNLPKLLAFLRNETYEETVDYLLAKYDYEYNSDRNISIEVRPLHTRVGNTEVPKDRYEGKALDKSYLIGRGIHPKVIEMNGIFDTGSAIGIPWRDPNGKVATIKYRMKDSKIFWYEKGATPVGRLVFGLNHVVERGIKRIAICEAEIDAMTWQSAGIMAVAVGGASLSDYQAELIISSGVDEVILAGDFDEQGKVFNEIVERKLRGKINTIKTFGHLMFNVKDANELGILGISQLDFTVKPFCNALNI